MSSEKSLAIVLRLVQWSETSLIVTLLTRDFGKISVVAKGAFRPSNPFDGALDLLSLCWVVFIDKPGDGLDILTEAKMVRRFRSGQQNLEALNCGYYLCELLQRATEADQAMPELFATTDETLRALDAGKSPIDTILRFELRCLNLLGHRPVLQACAVCEAPIPADARQVAFSVPAGGLLCSKCLPGQREILRLHNDSINFLRKLDEQDWDSGEPVFLPTPRRAEVRRLMNRLFESLLERRIGVSYLLDSLTR